MSNGEKETHDLFVKKPDFGCLIDNSAFSVKFDDNIVAFGLLLDFIGQVSPSPLIDSGDLCTIVREKLLKFFVLLL